MDESFLESAWAVRPYRPRDRASLSASLLPTLADLYPDGGKWLQGRLDDVEAGKARASVVYAGGLAGVSIQTPKETGRVKLSTLWVSPQRRRAGVGRSLLHACRREWLREEIGQADVTCASSVAGSLAPLLRSSGFSLAQICRDRYGEGRHEVVFSWSPDSDLAAPSRSADLPLASAHSV